MKSQKTSWPWDLEPKNNIWATWTQNTYLAITQEPWLQFLQTGYYFLKNYKMNTVKL